MSFYSISQLPSERRSTRRQPKRRAGLSADMLDVLCYRDWRSVARMVFFALVLPCTSANPSLQVDDPPRGPVQCESFTFAWRGGTPPFTFSIVPADTPGSPLEQFGGISSGSVRWAADVAAGTSIRFQVGDSTGASVDTGPIIIQAGSDNSCLHAAVHPQPQPTNPPTSTTSPSPIPPSSTLTSSAPVVVPSTSSPASGPVASIAGQTSPPAGMSAVTSTAVAGPTASSSSDAPTQTSPVPVQSDGKASPIDGASSVTVASAGSSLLGSFVSFTSSLASSTNNALDPDPTVPGEASPQPSLQRSHPHSTNMGWIVGIVIGILTLLLILSLLFLWHRRRRIAAAGQSLSVHLAQECL
ncbi:hypothetical protein BD414DRAFT_571896 [Trametes punicea]|nr:hypothetical protein BD414DRAFT_571896 [Trametes punicea]